MVSFQLQLNTGITAVYGQHNAVYISRVVGSKEDCRCIEFALVSVSFCRDASFLFSIANTILATFLVNAIIALPEPLLTFIVW